MTKGSTAEACANIALVKYWGKRDVDLNLPAAGSLAVAVAELRTTTRVCFDRPTGELVMEVDGRRLEGGGLLRAKRVVDAVRRDAGVSEGATVSSTNSFPGSSGLASSASGFAALALAAVRAAGLSETLERTAIRARRGSGSATRSLHGGFTGWRVGELADGSDSHGYPVLAEGRWDVRLVVAMVGEAPKEIGSTQGMLTTAATSPYHEAWLRSVEGDLETAERAVRERDLELLGTVAERSCLRMHADMLAADPGLIYWRGPTVELIRAVRELRKAGVGVWFTIDAGPHVKVLCEPSQAEGVANLLGKVTGVSRVLISEVGGPARVDGEAVWPEE